MMCKTTTILLLTLLGSCFSIYGQSNCGGSPYQVPPAESCPEACIYCSFNGYTGSTDVYTGNGIPPGGFCSSIQNDQWLGFVAGAASATFTVTPSNCENGNGLQIALYASCSSSPIACNGGGQNQGAMPQALAVSMVPGSNYFLLIDGMAGDICDFTLSVFPSNAITAQSVGTMGPVQGPSSALPGDTSLYEVAAVANAGTYTWTGPPGTLVNGAMVPVILPAPEGRKAHLTFPPGISGPVEICVNANNSCFAGPTQCKTVEVEGLAQGLIEGRVLWDINQNCIADAGDLPVQGAVVRFDGVQKRALPSKSDGSFRFFHAETGNITISIDPVPGLYWTPCGNNFIVTPTIPLDTSEVNFLLQPATPCSYLQVDLGLPPFFRLCASSKAKVKYSNKGSIAADSAYIELYIPPGLTVDSTSIPVAAQYGDTLRFDVGTVQPFQSETFTIYLRTDCSNPLGVTKCLMAHIYPDSICPPWTGAHVEVSAECVGDTTVRFKLRNTGRGHTDNNLEYIIIEDIVVLRQEPFDLAPGENMIIDEPANGSTWRLEADQAIGHPGWSMPTVSLEGCGGLGSLGLVNAFWQDDADDFVDIECKEIRGPYDPNIKEASPAGVGNNRVLGRFTPIEYIIHFQNTGNDTAFVVRLVDTLPELLNPLTFRPGASSHPCTWEFLDERILEVMFSSISLPDSNVNEPASHGWFEFSIEPLHKLPIGTRIENSAAIYFDFNAPIITDEAWHTVGRLAVSINKEPKTSERHSRWHVLGNPARESCTFQASKPISGQSRFQLTDAQGRVVRTIEFSGQQYTFERGYLTAGLYFFNIQTERDGVASGKIMLSD